MGEILQFKPRGRWPAPMEALLELGPGGSLAGATAPEVQQRALEANPMRRMLTLLCHCCQNEWKAPAMGACPKCHHEHVDVLGSEINMAQRLK